MPTAMIRKIRKELKDLSDKTVQQSAQAFFKEQIKTHGVRNADVRTVSKEVLTQLKGASKNSVFDLCEQLWQSGYLEESIIACDLAYSRRKEFDTGDIDIFERWIGSYVNNWASCDTFCNHTMGAFLLQYPEYVTRLKVWAVADNRWLKRAAAVSLIIPARQGKFLKEALQIAGIQLKDEDDLVRKGYGWLLKVASKMHEKTVFDFVMKHKAVMPRTALRYAIEKMPAELKAKVMAKQVDPNRL